MPLCMAIFMVVPAKAGTQSKRRLARYIPFYSGYLNFTNDVQHLIYEVLQWDIRKALLEQCGFSKSVEIEVEDKRLVLTPTAQSRSGWEEAFKRMAVKHDDTLLDTPAPAFDKSEWQW